MLRKCCATLLGNLECLFIYFDAITLFIDMPRYKLKSLVSTFHLKNLNEPIGCGMYLPLWDCCSLLIGNLKWFDFIALPNRYSSSICSVDGELQSCIDEQIGWEVAGKLLCYCVPKGNFPLFVYLLLYETQRRFVDVLLMYKPPFVLSVSCPFTPKTNKLDWG